MQLKTDDGNVRVGDLWLDDHNDTIIVTQINADDITIEVISDEKTGRVYYENPSNFGKLADGSRGFFHTLLSRSLND